MTDSDQTPQQRQRVLELQLLEGRSSLADTFVASLEWFVQVATAAAPHAGLSMPQRPACSLHWPHPEVLDVTWRLACARVHVERRDDESSIRIWTEVETDVLTIGCPALHAVFLSRLAINLMVAGRTAEAMHICSRALSGLQAAPNAAAERRLLELAGISLCIVGQYAEAQSYFQRCDESFVLAGLGRAMERATVLGNWANCMLHIEDGRRRLHGSANREVCLDARSKVRQGIDIIVKTADPLRQYLLVSALEVSAQASILLEDLEAARDCYRRIDALAEADLQCRLRLPRVAATRARMEILAQRPDLALDILDAAHEEVSIQMHAIYLVDWYETREQALAILGRWQEAHEAQQSKQKVWQKISTDHTAAVNKLYRTEIEKQHASTMQLLAHDIRAPLGSLVVLANSAGPDVSPQTLHRIEQLAERSLQIADSAVERLRSQQHDTPNSMPVDLAAVLIDACQDVQELADQARTTLTRNITKSSAWISGDHDLLRRAVVNLLTNAIRFSPIAGRVDVSLSCIEPLGWQIEVADQGPGFTASAGRHERLQGHGLGLAFVARVAGQHGARLTRAERCGSTGAVMRMSFRDSGTSAPKSPGAPASKSTSNTPAGAAQD